MTKTIRLAVIGAGLAGTACARRALRAGVELRVFDKGRGPGGRLSSRRAQTPFGEARFDHGAQYVTARGCGFASALREAEAAGAAARWDAHLVRLDAAGAAEPLADEPRWVGVPGMNGIVRTLQDGLDVRYGHRATHLEGGAGAWVVVFEDGTRDGPFTHVALTLPPVQLAAFLRASDGVHAELLAEAQAASLAPCWALMAAWPARLALGFDAAKIATGPIRWAARMPSRPGRAALEAWVLHAGPDWSRTHLEEAPETVAHALTEAFLARFGAPQPEYKSAHRWRYSLVERPAGTPCALAASGVGAAGDWRLGARAEHAFDSGDALGSAIVSRA
jgi:hypothetical protein